MFKFLIYNFGQFVVNVLPIRVSYRIAMFLSEMHYCLSFRDRRAVRNNLRVILKPGEDVEEKTKEVFRNFGKYLVEFFWMAKNLNHAFIKEKVHIKNPGAIDRALEKGKGAILMTAHIGNWEMGAVIIGMLGYSMTAIALPHKERPVNDLFNEQRSKGGLMIVPTNVGIRRCIETLKENNLVALVGDRDFSRRGEVMSFLGKDTLIPKGAALFSYKTGAPIVTCFMIRNNDDTFTLTFGDAIWPPREIPEEIIDRESMVVLIQKYLDVIEDQIYQYPSQWLMFRKFWLDKGSAQQESESN